MMLDRGVQAAYDRCGENFRPSYYGVAQILLVRNQATIGEVAEEIGFSQPAVTQIVGHMRRDGLVETLPLVEDRRVRTIALTDHGRATIVRLEPLWATIAQAIAVLEEEASVSLVETLDTVLAQLSVRPFSERIEEQSR